jgi:hypothetical protein
MEFVKGLLTAATAALSSYWPVIVFGLVVALFLVFLAIASATIIPAISAFLRAYADRVKSEQVRTRLNDAISKFDIVAVSIMQQSSELTKKEFMEIIADGTVEKKELTDLAAKLADLAMDQLGPEMATFKKYFAGEAVKKLFTGLFVTKISAFVAKKLGRTEELTADTVATPFP